MIFFDDLAHIFSALPRSLNLSICALHSVDRTQSLKVWECQRWELRNWSNRNMLAVTPSIARASATHGHPVLSIEQGNRLRRRNPYYLFNSDSLKVGRLDHVLRTLGIYELRSYYTSSITSWDPIILLRYCHILHTLWRSLIILVTFRDILCWEMFGFLGLYQSSL